MNKFEDIFHEDLSAYLVEAKLVDLHLPEVSDIENLWGKIGEAYLPDGIREYNQYPTVSLGWMMFIGMAVARYWDKDWQLYRKVDNLYIYLRDQKDFNHMDDYICEKVLLLNGPCKKSTTKIVAECASRTYNKILHQRISPGSKEAFLIYVAALHEMYLMGAAIELKRLGYHMTRLS